MTSTAGARGTAPAGSGGIDRLGPEVEILAGDERAPVGRAAPGPGLRRGVRAAMAAAGVGEGHVAVALVSSEEIRRLNRAHRGRDEATDVLSFPIDPIDEEASPGPRELGDVVICPEQTDHLVRAAVHGVLHLVGYDHETDGGEMLALEDRVVERLN